MLKGAPACENTKRYVDLTDEEESPLPQVSDIGGPSQTSTPLNSLPVGSLQLSATPVMPLPEQQSRPKSIRITLWTPPAPTSMVNGSSQTVSSFNKNYEVPETFGQTSIVSSQSQGDSYRTSYNFIDTILKDSMKSDFISL